MYTSGRREGFSHLIDWIIHFGNLFLINVFFILTYLIFNDSPVISDSMHYREKTVTFLFINLSYFIISSFIHFRIAFNVESLDKIIQRSTAFIAIYALFITAGFSIFRIISIPIIPWTIGFFILGTLFVGWHILFRILLKSYRRKGYNYRQVAIIGANTNGLKAYESLIFSDYGYKILGFFDDEPKKRVLLPDPDSYLGSISDIHEYVETNDVDEIYCTISGSNEEVIQDLIILCEKKMIRFFLVPEFDKFFKRRYSLNFIGATPVISLRYEPLQHFSNRFIKRCFDILFSALVLIFIFPLIYIVFGFIIKRSSPGPVFFKQKRTGIRGKEFYCYKFRSMRLNEQANSKQAVEGDPRVTKIGAFMRKTSIDELPQFINVLRNEMSIVGPRPHMLQHTELYSSIIDRFMVRHLVKPGITGWAQVTGCRGETRTVEEMEERVKKDVWYLENWTFFLDLKIMLLTVVNAIRGERKAY